MPADQIVDILQSFVMALLGAFSVWVQRQLKTPSKKPDPPVKKD